MKRTLMAAFAATTALAANPATAAVTFYTSVNAFTAALGNSGTVENFDDRVLVPGLTIASDNGSIGGGTFNDRLESSNQVRTTFTFANGQNGFGGLFDLTPGGAGLGIQIRLVGNGGLLNQEVPNGANGQFFGFISDEAFDVVRFVGGTQAANGSSETYTLDNLRFGALTAGAVPEPATWAMMIAGFGLVGGAMRRRSTKIAFA